MTTDTRWAEQRRRLQLRWPALTAEDLDPTEGDRDALLGLLQARLGYAPANAAGDLDEILSGETVVPRDVADEDSHTGTSGPVGNPSVGSGQSSQMRRVEGNAPAPPSTGTQSRNEYTHSAPSEVGGSYEARVSSPDRTTRPAWQIPALAIAVVSALAAGWLLMRSRRSRRRLRLEVPLPGVPAQFDLARELAGQALDAGRHAPAVLGDAAHRIAPRIEVAAERVEDKVVEKAAGGMQEAAGYLREHKAREIKRDLGHYLTQHPVRTALLAGATGIVVGRRTR